MAKIRYYTDEHVAYAVIHGLRQRGVDVVSVPEEILFQDYDMPTPGGFKYYGSNDEKDYGD